MSNIIKKPRLIVYDWDGTLADTAYIVADVVNRLRDDCGEKPLKPSEIMNYTGDPDSNWVIELFGKYSDEFAQTYDEYYEEANKRFNVKIFDYVEELVKTVNKFGAYQAILTNKDTHLAIGECKKNSIFDYFFTILGGDNIPRKKPFPDGVEKIINDLKSEHQIDIQKEDMWFVGDTLIDVATAKNVGCTSIYVGESRFIRKPYDEYITKSFDIKGLLDFFKSL